MQRIIKFRAWDTAHKKMFSPYEMGQDELQLNPDGRGFFNASSLSPKLSQYYPHMIPLQYTGLKDKNGAEGYYTDILNASFQDNWVVDWDEDEGNYYLRSLLGYDPLPLRKMKDMVIIGNIWENHELLEAKEYDK